MLLLKKLEKLEQWGFLNLNGLTENMLESDHKVSYCDIQKRKTHWIAF